MNLILRRKTSEVFRGFKKCWNSWSWLQWLTPIFSRDLASTSQPFFWLTKMMMGGSKPCDNTSSSFFLHHTECKNHSVWHFDRNKRDVWCLHLSVSPLLALWHKQDLLFNSLVRFASRPDVHHSRASQVAPGQSLHSWRHGSCEHDCLKVQTNRFKT